MSYFANPDHVEYEELFDENIDPIYSNNYSNKHDFTDFIHEQFNQLSFKNLIIVSSNNYLKYP